MFEVGILFIDFVLYEPAVGQTFGEVILSRLVCPPLGQTRMSDPPKLAGCDIRLKQIRKSLSDVERLFLFS
jgi:hypothetical protein